MPCCGGLVIYPGQYKSPTGLEMDGCPIRLKELNQERHPAPTRLVGAEVARGNLIRRRVGTMKAPSRCFGYKGEQCNPNIAYGPVFGFRQAPRFGSRCGNGGFRNIYSANHGDSSDVIMWKKIYGGPRQLFSTKACKFGCCGNTVADLPLPNGRRSAHPGRLNSCNCYTVSGVQQGDAVWKNDGSIPNFYEAIGVGTTTVQVRDRSSSMGRYMRHSGGSLLVYRRNTLNQWKQVGTTVVGVSAAC